MADSMLAAAADGAEGAVLIAGSGHVREDRAVPWHLGGRGGGDALTLALVEVAAGSLAARDSAAFDRTLFDFVWFTPRVDEDDPCEPLRSRPADPPADYATVSSSSTRARAAPVPSRRTRSPPCRR